MRNNSINTGHDYLYSVPVLWVGHAVGSFESRCKMKDAAIHIFQ